MPKKPTPADADLILKLYDLRREAEIRKARKWWLADFWPETADDFMKIAQALGTQKNNWLRQVGGVIGNWPPPWCYTRPKTSGSPLVEFSAEFAAAREKPQQESHASAIQHIAAIAGLPEVEARSRW